MRTLALVGATLLPITALGQTETPPFDLVLNPVNGHFYGFAEFESLEMDDRTWHVARDQAASFVFHGWRGHLATFTSAAEEAFVQDVFGGQPGWIGASDAAVEGEWRWVTGPEAGTLFWLGAGDGQSVGYSNWYRGETMEPNDARGVDGGEDFAMDSWVDLNGWNDMPTTRGDLVAGYFVEFSIPEPSAISLIGCMASVGGALLMFKNGSSKCP